MANNNRPVAPEVREAVWKELFTAAFKFYPLMAWDIFSENDLIGVYNIEKNE